MDMESRNMYSEAIQLAEMGQHEAALAKLQEYLRLNPMDGEAMNDAGTILFCMHRGREAIDYFLRARTVCRGDQLTQVYWNLCEACIAENRPEIAIDLLDTMEEAHVLHADILNRLARLFIDRDDCGTALDLLCRSLGMSSNQDVLEPMMEILRNKRGRLTIAGRPDEIQSDLVEFFRLRYPMMVCRTMQLREIQSAVTADGVLLFWGADPVLEELTRTPVDGRLIVRLCWRDVYDPVLQKVNWNHVNALILPDEASRQALMEWVNYLPPGLPVSVVRPAPDTTTDIPVPRSRGKKIAAVGPWDAGSNPMFLLQCIQKLHYMDNDMRFYLAGEFPDPAVENYVHDMIERMELDHCVFLDGRPRNWSRWFRDKHYVVSTAIDARSMLSVYRGMAAGLKPVVHAFGGAERYIERECLFVLAEDFCERILSEDYQPEQYWAYAAQCCSRSKELGAIDRMIRQFERKVNRPAVSSAGAAGQLPAGPNTSTPNASYGLMSSPAEPVHVEPVSRPASPIAGSVVPAPLQSCPVTAPPVSVNQSFNEPAAASCGTSAESQTIEQIALAALEKARQYAPISELPTTVDAGSNTNYSAGGVSGPF